MLTDREIKKFTKKFFTSFELNSMILFVGEKTDDTVLTENLCSQKWSCVITTCREPKFAEKFKTKDREVYDLEGVDKISDVPLSRDPLNIIRLKGIEGYEEPPKDDIDIILDVVTFLNKLKLSNLLRYLNHMYIVGCDYNDNLIQRAFNKTLTDVVDGNVSFFGVTPELKEGKPFAELFEKFNVYEEELSQIIESADETDYDIDIPDYAPNLGDNCIFYKGGKPVIIENDDLVKTRSFASLLTDQLIYSFRPYGRQLNTAFARFLDNSSSEGPQWYGYFQNSDFHLKRSFEDPLVYLVKRALEGKKIVDDIKYSTNVPIILTGSSCSGKSIALAALAYRIYDEKINPVIFIKDPNISLSRNSNEFRYLDSLMEQIDSLGASTRILLIWDTSSHSNVLGTARNLAKALNDRGRRFVLVCSSYENECSGNNRYTWHENSGFNKSDSDNNAACLTVSSLFYSIKADKNLSVSEIKALRNKFNEYTSISYSSKCWDILEKDEDQSALAYFYKLINIIRPKLEKGLSREHNLIVDFVNEKLYNIKREYIDDENKNTNETIMEHAFKKSGIDLSEFGISEDDLIDTEAEEPHYDLEKFNNCIALFSLFKLPTPSSLAFSMLSEKDIDYSNGGGRAMFIQVTSSFPWLSYSVEGNDSVFRFRSTFEAQRYLAETLPKDCERHEYQLNIILEAIDFYTNFYLENSYVYVYFSKILKNFLRKIGPNSDTEKGLFDAAGYVKENLNKIIEKLENMRKNGVPDIDAGFGIIEVTFLREYYVNYLKTKETQKEIQEDKKENLTADFYEERLRKMKEAINIAAKLIEDLEDKIRYNPNEKKYLSKPQMYLTVELIHCNIEAEAIRRNYVELGEKNKWKIDSRLKESKFILPYEESFRRLEKAINQDPVNSYTYNALFKLFLEEYKSNRLDENHKLKYLSEIMAIIDNIDSFSEIYIKDGSSGGNELSDNVARITELASDRSITIKDITERSSDIKPFLDLYDRMLEEDNPSAIMLVCRQEQIRAKIIPENPTQNPAENILVLSPEQKKICQEIKNFMEKPENLRCVRKSEYAVYMLFKITWMLYEGRTFSVKNECQATHLTKEQWEDINKICEYYDATECKNPLPSMRLMHALSILQLTNNYEKSEEILKRINEENFYREDRMHVPFMLCDENGTFKKFSGSVYEINENNAFIRVNGIRYTKTIRYSKINKGNRDPLHKGNGDTLHKGQYLTDLELGVRYTGFALYSEEGRKRRSKNNE